MHTHVLCCAHGGGGLVLCASGPHPQAPEVYLHDYSYEVDMWSTGVMLYQLFTRRSPFWEGDTYDAVRSLSVDEVGKAISEVAIPYDYGPWLGMSAEGLDFIQACLVRDPSRRMGVDEALAHKWFETVFGASRPAVGSANNIVSGGSLQGLCDAATVA